jgi:hypothetical protein
LGAVECETGTQDEGTTTKEKTTTTLGMERIGRKVKFRWMKMELCVQLLMREVRE